MKERIPIQRIEHRVYENMIILKWLSEHKFIVHPTAFLLMVVPPFPMFLAARTDADKLVWIMLIPVIVGNILALLTR